MSRRDTKVDEVAQRGLQLRRLYEAIEGDAMSRVINARADWGSCGGAYRAVLSMLDGKPNRMVDDELRAVAAEWSLQACVHLRHAMAACIAEIARQLRTTTTTADAMLWEYLEGFDNDEPIPSEGFKAWVETLDKQGSDDDAAAE